MRLCDEAAQIETELDAAGRALASRRRAGRKSGQPGQFRFVDTRPVVANRQFQRLGIERRRDDRRQGAPAL